VAKMVEFYVKFYAENFTRVGVEGGFVSQYSTGRNKEPPSMVVKVACSKPLSVMRVVWILCNVKRIDCLNLNSIVDYAKRISLALYQQANER
jgi:hypothetical protein